MSDSGHKKDNAKKPKTIASVFSGKVFRLGLALGITATALAVIAPRVVYYRSINAVVSGRLSYFLAPIEGRIVGGVPAVGDWVDAQDTLIHLRNFRLNHGVLFELITEHDSLKSRVNALNKQMVLTQKYFEDFQDRTLEWQHAAIDALDGEYTQVEYEKKAATAKLKATQAQLARVKTLMQSGHTTQKELDDTTANLEWQRNEIESLSANLQYLHILRTQIQEGVFVASSRFGTPYYEQRGDELKIRLLSLQAEKIEAEARMERISKQIEKEQTRLDQEGEAVIAASFGGVVWEVNASTGREMLLGEELLSLLDCNSIFLDVLVPERRYEDIRIGDEIQYRLSGEAEFRTAHVKGRRGSVATVGNKTLATQINSDDTDAFRIEADLGDLSMERRDFCNVGRRAEVRFKTGVPLLEGTVQENLTALRNVIRDYIPDTLNGN